MTPGLEFLLSLLIIAVTLAGSLGMRHVVGFLTPRLDRLLQRVLLRPYRRALTGWQKASRMLRLLGASNTYRAKRVKETRQSLLLAIGAPLVVLFLFLTASNPIWLLLVFLTIVTGLGVLEPAQNTASTRGYTAITPDALVGIAAEAWGEDPPGIRHEVLYSLLANQPKTGLLLLTAIQKSGAVLPPDFYTRTLQLNSGAILTPALEGFATDHPAAALQWVEALAENRSATDAQLTAALPLAGQLPAAKRRELLLRSLQLRGSKASNTAHDLLLEHPDWLRAADYRHLCQQRPKALAQFAVLQLGHVGEAEDADYLEQLLRAQHPELQAPAAIALLQLAAPRAEPYLEGIDLRNTPLEVAQCAATQLAAASPSKGRTAALVSLLGHSDQPVRNTAAQVLHKRPAEELLQWADVDTLTHLQLANLCRIFRVQMGKGAITLLQQLTVHPTATVRTEALDALYAIDPDTARPHLLAATQDTRTPQLAKHAHARLLHYKDSSTLGHILKAMEALPARERTTPTLHTSLALKTALQENYQAQAHLRQAGPTLFCTRTLRRPTTVHLYGIPFFVLPGPDYDIRAVQTGIEAVVGVIGDAPPPQPRQYHVPLWDEPTKTATLADIDVLEIRPSATPINYDWAINAVLDKLTEAGRTRLPVKPYVPLSANAERLVTAFVTGKKG